MNQALEHLSKIQVDGLPKFKTPIVFVPCDAESSDYDSQGNTFEPDLAIMTLEYARELYGLNELDAPTISEFASKISKGCSISSIGWQAILSVVEMRWEWDPPGCPSPRIASQDMRDLDQRLDDEPDTSQPTTCKIDPFPYEHPLTWAGQRFRRRPWYPPNGRRAPRG